MAFHGSRGDGTGMGGDVIPQWQPITVLKSSLIITLYPLFPILTAVCYRVTADFAQSRDGSAYGGRKVYMGKAANIATSSIL